MSLGRIVEIHGDHRVLGAALASCSFPRHVLRQDDSLDDGVWESGKRCGCKQAVTESEPEARGYVFHP